LRFPFQPNLESLASSLFILLTVAASPPTQPLQPRRDPIVSLSVNQDLVLDDPERRPWSRRNRVGPTVPKLKK